MAAAILAQDAEAALKVDSAGVYEGGPDPFVGEVLDEIGVSLGGAGPKALSEINLGEFDLIITLTPEAAGEVRRWIPRERIEYWPIDNPSDVRGGRDELMQAYREVRDELRARIRSRFPAIYEKP